MRYVKVSSILITTILLWASAFVGIKIALVDYSPGALALLRFLVASLCMAIIYPKQKMAQTISWKDRLSLALAGMGGIGVYNMCLNYGELTVSAGIASFIIGLMPVMAIILAVIFYQEQLKNGAWLGILISLTGLFILAAGEGDYEELQHGVLFVLISAVMSAFLTIIQKKFLNKYPSIVVMSWVIWGGTLFLLIFLPQLVQEMPYAALPTTATVIYMGIFPATIAYLTWSYVLKHMPIAKAATTLYALPLVSTSLGFLFLGEEPSSLSLIGGSVALLGALIAHRFQKQNDINLSLDKKVVAV